MPTGKEVLNWIKKKINDASEMYDEMMQPIEPTGYQTYGRKNAEKIETKGMPDTANPQKMMYKMKDEDEDEDEDNIPVRRAAKEALKAYTNKKPK